MVSKNADNFFPATFQCVFNVYKVWWPENMPIRRYEFSKSGPRAALGLISGLQRGYATPNTCQKMLLGGSEEITWLFWVYSSFLEAFACIQCTVGSFLWSGIWNTHLCYDWYPRRTLPGISFVNFITFSWFLLHLIEQTTFYNSAEYLFKRRDTFKDMGHSGSLHPPIMNSGIGCKGRTV